MILTSGDSLGDLVAAQGLGITVAPGDVDAIEAALVRLLSDGLPLADFGPTLARFQWPEVARPLLRWLRAPAPCPRHRNRRCRCSRGPVTSTRRLYGLASRAVA